MLSHHVEMNSKRIFAWITMIIIASGCASTYKINSEQIRNKDVTSTPSLVSSIIDSESAKNEVMTSTLNIVPLLTTIDEPVYGTQYPFPLSSTSWSFSPDTFFYSIAVGGNNDTWFATTNGVFNYKNDSWTQFTTTDGLPSNEVYSIKVAPNGNAWALAQDGDAQSLYNFKGKNWEKVGNTNNRNRTASNANGSDLVIASNGDIWVIGNGGIFSYDGKNWESHIISGYVTSDHLTVILAIATKPDGTIWVSALRDSDGKPVLLKFDGIQWSANVFPDMPKVNYISEMSFAGDGSLWVGGNGGEAPYGSLAHYDSITWKIYSTDDGLANDYINAMAVAMDGVWYTTPNAVYLFNGKSCKTITNAKYYSIAISPIGEVWLGGWGEVGRLSPTKNTNY